MVDNSKCSAHARQWIEKLAHYLGLAYKENQTTTDKRAITSYINENFPEASRSALHLLPTHMLPYGPLYSLLEGFVTDLEFDGNFPIATSTDLETYAAHVAGTVAELVLNLVFYHLQSNVEEGQRNEIIRAGYQMGIALQYVNIARDIENDSPMGRTYLPTDWLLEEGLTPQDVIKNPHHPKIKNIRDRLLAKSFKIYEESLGPIELLPKNAQAPIRVCVESYMEIGRVLGEKGYAVREGKATVPKMRRLRVALKALRK